ncbi:MAG TPA: RNA polymerase subunit sigma-24, partial [Streptosporangiaceae bacterium]
RPGRPGQAWEAKDINALIGLLDPGATVIADGGGLVSAALRPIEGSEQIASYIVAFDVAGDQIKRIWAVRNPGKLRPWTAH